MQLTAKDTATAGVIVLAAGQSRRFGSQKLLSRLADGSKLIERTIQLALFCELPVLVVVDRLQSELVEVVASYPVKILAIDHAADGLGVNLARAVTAAKDWTGWLVMLGDMPFISADTLAKVLQQADSEKLIVPVDQGRRGHPVCFGSNFYHDLIRLQGDSGGKSILQRYAHQLIQVDVNDPGIFADIDTPDDLLRWQNSFSIKSNIDAC